jgi:hypothetical protein
VILRKAWRFIALAVVIVGIVIANIALAPIASIDDGKGGFVDRRVLPFSKGYTLFKVSEIVEDYAWVEAAPVVLANHFKHVHVYNVGDVLKNGFSFQQELVRIYKTDSVDRSHDPIDLRGKINFTALNVFKQYPARAQYKGGTLPPDTAPTHCGGRVSKYCAFSIYWDDRFPTTSATFVGVRLSDNSYALVEKNLLAKLTKAN